MNSPGYYRLTNSKRSATAHEPMAITVAPLSGDLRDRVARNTARNHSPSVDIVTAMLQRHHSPETHLEFFRNQLKLLLEEQYLVVHLPERFRAVAPSAVSQ
jgi:hypothetical protein